MQADATQLEDVKLIEAVVGAHGRIDALINSVGTNLPRRAISELTDASWQRVLDINLTSAFHITQAIVPVFRQQKEGLLIHIASSAARKPDRSGIAYQATKAGVAAFAHGAMEEERENGLRITVIYPGMTETPRVPTRLRRLWSLDRQCPSGRVCAPLTTQCESVNPLFAA